jgi:hypothetical protein
MAGILDKKSRLFDYQFTLNGKKQMQNNDLRFVYATISDKSIVYTADDEKSIDNKSKIDGSEFFYLPLEVSVKDNNDFSKEFKFDPDSKTYSDKYTFNIVNNNLVQSGYEALKTYSISSKIKNQGIILTKSGLMPDTLTFKIISSNEDSSFNFKNTVNINKYPTILNVNTSVKNIEPLQNDKRFSEKINFLKMPPVNDVGESVFNTNRFPSVVEFNKKSNIDFIFRSFKEKITFENENSREKTLSDILSVMEKSKQILKKEYSLIEEDDLDTFFLEMFEINVDETGKSTPEGVLEKLLFVNLGEIFDVYKDAYKKIYLVGKVMYNEKELEEIDDIKNKNEVVDKIIGNESGYRYKNYALSNLYSFVNMFTIVVE